MTFQNQSNTLRLIYLDIYLETENPEFKKIYLINYECNIVLFKL